MKREVIATRWLSQVGSWSDTATAQRWLGEGCQQVSDLSGVRRWWIEALAICEYHRHPDVDVLRAKLAALPEN